MKPILLFCLLLVFASGSATVYSIQLEDDFFNPAELTVNVGDTVRWFRETTAVNQHTSTSTSVPAGASSWDLLIYSSTVSYSYTVVVPGIYDFHCNHHAGMTGSFTAMGITGMQKASAPFLKVYNPVTEQRLMFSYELKEQGPVEIMMMDMAGSTLVKISTGMRSSGSYSEEYPLPALAKGIYLLQLKTEDGIVTKQVVL